MTRTLFFHDVQTILRLETTPCRTYKHLNALPFLFCPVFFLERYILLCAWCDDGMPLRKNKRSPCRASGPSMQGDLYNWKDNLCAADDRTPSVDQCPSYNCSSAGDTCLRCLTGRNDCAWDPGASTCVPTQTPYSYTTFPLVWGESTLCPEVCGQHKTCSECGAADGCGWCDGSCLPSDPADGTKVNFRVTGSTCTPFDTTGVCPVGAGARAGGVVAAVFITIAVVTVGMWVGAIVALRRGALPSCVAQSPCMGCVTKSSQMLPGGDAAGGDEGNYKDLNTVLS